jgi:hypothetical protein
MFKRLFLILIIAAAAFAAWRTSNPTPLAADTGAAGLAARTESAMGRVKLSIGRVGVRVAGGQIRASVARTERELHALKPAIQRTQGRSQKRALAVSRTTMRLDSLALAALDGSHPVSALKLTIDARGYIAVIREEVSEEIAAR